MKRYVSFVIMIIILALAFGTASLADGVSLLSGDVSGNTGSTVVIPIVIRENPGFSEMLIGLGFEPSLFSLDNVVCADGFTATLKGDGAYEPYSVTVSPENGGASSFTGNLLSVTITIKSETEPDTYDFDLDIDYALDADKNELEVSAIPSTITVNCAHLVRKNVIDAEAGCTENGFYHTECTVCGETVEENIVIPAKGHQFGEWETTVESTCRKGGEHQRKCLICEIVEIEETEKAPHRLSEWTVVTAPTCQSEGSEVRVCLDCFETIDSRIVPTADHSYGPWETVKEAEVGVAGLRKRKCIYCEHAENEEIPPLEEVHQHKMDGRVIITEEATCTTPGARRIYCSFPGCGEWTEETIPALGHNRREVTVKSATCSAAGLVRVECERCGEVFEEKTTPVLGHTYQRWVTTREATCQNVGLQSCTCTSCGYVITRLVGKKDHEAGEWEITEEATCTTAGIRIKKCTMCGTLLESETVEAKGHGNVEWKVLREPTCTVTGLKNGVCMDCGAVLEEQISTALGHKYGEWTTVMPSAGADGSKKRVCTECGNEEVIVLKRITAPQDGGDITLSYVSEEGSVSAARASALEKNGTVFAAASDSVGKVYKNADIIKLYDITAGEVSGTVTARTEIPDESGYVNPKVYLIGEDGSAAPVNAETSGGVVIFPVEESGKYAVCGVRLSDPGKQSGSDGEGKSDVTFVVILVIAVLFLAAEGVLAYVLIKKRNKRMDDIR